MHSTRARSRLSTGGRTPSWCGERTRSAKIRTYVLGELDGRLGTICVYEANDPDAVREHARAARIPCDEVVPIVAIDVKRPDPQLAVS
jgi:hypothetical protein